MWYNIIMKDKFIIGIDAGGSKVAYGLFDGAGVLVGRMQHATDASADGMAFSDAIAQNVRAMLEKGGLTFEQLSGVGIGMPSFLLHEQGHVYITSSMPGIKDFPMRSYLQERLPVRITLDNDANAAALAEYRRGAGRGSRHMVYVVIGTGLGSGIIIDGKPFHGTYGWAGECGHMLAGIENGLMCGCENSGCFMSLTSGKHLPARARMGLDSGIGSALNPDSVDGHALKEACISEDPLAVELIGQMARYLAICVFNIYQMLNINTFVFGGGLTGLGDMLFDRVRAEFDRYNHIPLPVHFKMAELGEDIGIIGAAELLRSADRKWSVVSGQNGDVHNPL